jgi:ribose transport system permease protein
LNRTASGYADTPQDTPAPQSAPDAQGADPAAARPAAPARRRGGAGGLRAQAARHANLLGPIGALVVMFGLFSALAPTSFPTPDNLWNIASQVSVIGVLGAGLTFVLLLGQIDLGVAAVSVMAGIIASVVFGGLALKLPFGGSVDFAKGSQWTAIILAIAVSVALGALAGVLTKRLGIPSFIGTLGVLQVAQGLAYYWSQGKTLYNLPPLSVTLGGGFAGPVPYIVITAAVILLAGHLVLSRTRFGRYVYMTGANPKAAELAGVPVRRITLYVFIISGGLAALAGLLNIGRLGSAQATSGDDLLLPAIAAVVLGGTSLFGGVGSMKNTVVGVLLYGVLNNGLDQLNMDVYLKPFASGAFLLMAITFNLMALRVASRAQMRASVDEAAAQSAPAPATAA